MIFLTDRGRGAGRHECNPSPISFILMQFLGLGLWENSANYRLAHPLGNPGSTTGKIPVLLHPEEVGQPCSQVLKGRVFHD